MRLNNNKNQILPIEPYKNYIYIQTNTTRKKKKKVTCNFTSNSFEYTFNQNKN